MGIADPLLCLRRQTRKRPPHQLPDFRRRWRDERQTRWLHQGLSHGICRDSCRIATVKKGMITPINSNNKTMAKKLTKKSNSKRVAYEKEQEKKGTEVVMW